MSDAVVVDALLATKNTPEGLYGRRKMIHHLRRQGLEVAFCTVDRLMRQLGMNGIRRGKGIRTTVPREDADRAADLRLGVERSVSSLLVFDRWDVPDGAVQPPGVVPAEERIPSCACRATPTLSP